MKLDQSVQTFDHFEIWEEASRIKSEQTSTQEINQKVAETIIKKFLVNFHQLPSKKRWEIYATGGYRHGTEDIAPHQQTQDDVLRHLQLTPNSKVAEISGGTGPLLRAALQSNIPFEEWVITDVRPMLEMARARTDLIRNASACSLDLNSPVPENFPKGFTKWSSQNAIEFLENQLESLKRIKQICAPEATGVITTPKEGTTSQIDTFRNHLKYYDLDYDDAFWNQMHEQMNALWSEIFDKNGIKPEKIPNNKNAKKYIEGYIQIFTRVLDTVDLMPIIEIGKKDEIWEHLCITMLANAFPPGRVIIPPRDKLYKKIESAGLRIQKITNTNGGFSDLIQVKSV